MDHENFVKLVGYLNHYRQSISYESGGLINTRTQTDENDVIGNQRDAKFSAANLFPLETEGPQKGKHIPRRDERGNIIVDPTANLQKEPLFIDFDLYSRYKKMAQKGKVVQLKKNITRTEREEIKKLFAPHVPLCSTEPVESDLSKYRKKKTLTRQMIKNEREGQDAGTKDVLVVGAPPRKHKIKNTLPPFKPEDCGHRYVNKRPVVADPTGMLQDSERKDSKSQTQSFQKKEK